MENSRLTLYSVHKSVALCGGDVSIETLTHILRSSFGYKVDERIPRFIRRSDGPTRFFHIDRIRLGDRSQSFTYRDAMEPHIDSMFEANVISYELGLRWLLNSPFSHLHGYNLNKPVNVFPPEPLVINGTPQFLRFWCGPECPIAYLYDCDDLNCQVEGDLLTAWEIDLDPSPFSR